MFFDLQNSSTVSPDRFCSSTNCSHSASGLRSPRLIFKSPWHYREGISAGGSIQRKAADFATLTDKAPLESFFVRLKLELVYAKDFRTIEEARSGIFSYIEVFYNRKRRHLVTGGVSPALF